MVSWSRTGFNFTRKFATASHDGHTSSHETMVLWKRLSYFVGFPAIVLGTVNAVLSQTEHEHHERPEFVAYDHMRVRNKPFPWGDGNHSLFHNKEVNALPTGYEE